MLAENMQGRIERHTMKDEALESYHKALAYFSHVTGTLEALGEDEQTAVGKSIFYSTASLMDEFSAPGENGAGRPLMSNEIREKVASWSEEERNSLETRVREFRESDQASAMLAVATGAAEWALERWCELEADGENADQQNKTNVGIIHLCGTGYATEAGKFADAVNGMIREGKQDLAQSIVDATINA